MKLEWMGEYREFVEALVRFGNVWSQSINTAEAIKTNACNVSGTELQVLEYTLENEELHYKMAQIAQRLSIPQSTFSKVVTQLVKKGLLEKYHTKHNNKDVIIMVTDKGRMFYNEYVRNAVNGKWGAMFKKLDELPAGSTEIITDMLNEFSCAVCKTSLDRAVSDFAEDSLVKID